MYDVGHAATGSGILLTALPFLPLSRSTTLHYPPMRCCPPHPCPPLPSPCLPCPALQVQFISFYIPLWIAVAFNGYAYWKVLRTLHSTIKLAGPNDPSAENIRKVMKRLSVYPFILVIVWTVESINAIVSAATGNSYFALALIGATLACTQGMLNCLAYGLSSGVRDAIRDMLAPYCKCVRPSQSLATQVLIAPAAGGGAGKDNATSAATVPAAATAPRFSGVASPGGGGGGAPLDDASKARAHSAQALDEDVDDRALAVPPPASLSTPVR